MHFTVFRQRPNRQYTVFGCIVHVGAAVHIASGHYQFVVFLHFTVYDNATKHLRGSGMSFVPIGVGRHYACLSIFNKSRTPLPIAGMFDDTQTECGQRFAMCHCIWHGHITFVGRQIIVLLLARIQCEFI